MAAEAPEAAECNEVRLVGRISGEPIERELPSGDVLVSFRLVVPRSARAMAHSGVKVDTIDVSCFAATPRRRATALTSGDHAEVTGSLRRRFFKTPSGAQSRYEVEAHAVRRAKG